LEGNFSSTRIQRNPHGRRPVQSLELGSMTRQIYKTNPISSKASATLELQPPENHRKTWINLDC
jgi:hypothetical protein